MKFMKTSLFAGAGVLMLGLVFSAHAALIGTITHDYGLGYSTPSLGGASCDNLHSNFLEIRTPGRRGPATGCQRFYDVFDFSTLNFDTIDGFELTLSFSHTQGIFKNWHARPAAGARTEDGSGQLFQLSPTPNRVTSQTFWFDSSLDVFDSMVSNQSFYLWMAQESFALGASQNFRLYDATLNIYGTEPAASVPAPATFILVGLGLLGLRLRRR